MTEGTVKFFNEAKHFGFVTAEDGKEYFVHASSLKAGVVIKEGDKVSFDVVQGDRGPKADNIQKL
jgi:cold shock protein